MSFKPELSGPAPVAHPGVEALGFLSSPVAESAAPETQDWAKAEKSREEARKRSLRALNALRIVGPLLVAVMEYPGAEAGEEAVAKSFKELVSNASAFSEKVARELGVDPLDQKNFWIRNMLERAFSEVLRETWVKSKKADFSGMEKAVQSLLDATSPEEPLWREFEPLGMDAHLRAAVIKSAAPILMKSQVGFDFFRNMDEEIEPIMRRIMGHASKASMELAEEKASDHDRASLFSILMSEAGNMYATAWWVEGKKAVDNLSRLSNKELDELLKLNPKGLPLDSVNEQFEKNFGRLVGLANKLIPQRPGRIDSRLRTAQNETKGKAIKGSK